LVGTEIEVGFWQEIPGKLIFPRMLFLKKLGFSTGLLFYLKIQGFKSFDM
jgi:hypothetical protein